MGAYIASDRSSPGDAGAELHAYSSEGSGEECPELDTGSSVDSGEEWAVRAVRLPVQSPESPV